LQSWRVRLKVLPLLQGELIRFLTLAEEKLNGIPVFYFRQVPLIGEGKIVEIVEVRTIMAAHYGVSLIGTLS